MDFNVSGGTWTTDPALNLDGLAILLQFPRGLSSTAPIRVSGPSGWNGGQVWSFNVPPVARGAWIWRELVGPQISTGTYTVAVTVGGRTTQKSFTVDASQRLSAPVSVQASNITSSSVAASWSAVVGALSYQPSVNEFCPTTSCAVLAFRYLPGSATATNFTGLSFASGSQYFVGLHAFNVDLSRSPITLPRQFNIGYRPSSTFIPVPGQPPTGTRVWFTQFGRIARINDMSGAGLVQSGNEIFIPVPTGLTLDATGRIYVLSLVPQGEGLARIYRIDNLAGSGLIIFPPNVFDPRQFSRPDGIALDRQGRIYVADTWNHRIVRMNDMAGNGWTTFGSRGSGVNQFSFPTGVFADAQGRIYVADRENARVVRIDDMSGQGWVTYGRFGDGVGAFNTPEKVWVDSVGRIYLTDIGPTVTGSGNHDRVVRINDMSGNGWVTYAIPGVDCGSGGCIPPTDIAVDSSSRIYIGDNEGGIVRIDSMTGAGFTRLRGNCNTGPICVDNLFPR